MESFKPYYNWNTFNTEENINDILLAKVLNLIITGIPSIQVVVLVKGLVNLKVLNLIITGIPSIPKRRLGGRYYVNVLNLIITGIPSILLLL